MVRWTVDTEFDWGGRTQSTLGLKYGIPIILELFKKYKVKGLFFISTELLRDHRNVIQSIKDEGHELGSHGHFHVVYKDRFRAHQDMEISKALITGMTGNQYPRYRAPKFSFDNGDEYANPRNHTSLLKYTWGLQILPENGIFYMHPFDIIDAHQDAPNLFCKLWYSRPKDARNNLENLLSQETGIQDYTDYI